MSSRDATPFGIRDCLLSKCGVVRLQSELPCWADETDRRCHVYLDEFQQPSGEPEFAESTIGAENSFPANASLQLTPYAQSASRPSYNPSTVRREYRPTVDFASYRTLEHSILSSASRFDSANERLLTSSAQESEAHESVDHAFDEFDEEELAMQQV